MRRCALLLCTVVTLAVAAPPSSLRQQIQERLLGTSVQVVAELSSGMGTYSVRGSGTVFKRNGRTYILLPNATPSRACLCRQAGGRRR